MRQPRRRAWPVHIYGVGDAASTVVDAEYRRGATQAHSATHLVNAALRQMLGDGTHQAGSYNKPGYLRFDFSWGQALSDATKSEIEEIANVAVRDNLEVTTRVLSLDEAKAAGAMALFGEKYGDNVRVLSMGGDFSVELCGGIHANRTGDISLLKIVSEGGVAAGVRRIEALTGDGVFKYYENLEQELNELDQLLEQSSSLPGGRESRQERKDGAGKK